MEKVQRFLTNTHRAALSVLLSIKYYFPSFEVDDFQLRLRHCGNVVGFLFAFRLPSITVRLSFVNFQSSNKKSESCNQRHHQDSVYDNTM